MMKTACLLLSLSFALFSHAQKNNFTVTAYYAGDTAQINRYDPQKFTHIIFSFCHLKGNRLSVDTKMDTLRIQKLVGLKQKNPELKVLLSLGGWGGCATCSDVFLTDAARKEFAASVKELNTFFNSDGIDLDWEYPAIEGHPGHTFRAEDKQNFTALIADLRTALGNKNEISFAAGGFQKFIDEAIEWERVMKMVDRVNLMSYDLVNGYSKTTGHHTALYSTQHQKESADNAITALLKIGVPANKIVIGAAFYGRVWEAVPEINNGLYQPGNFKSSAGFRDFEKSFNKKDGFVYHWDSIAKAPYLFNKTKGLFVTYDDKRSLTEKANYVVAKGLNGIMFWELAHDVSNNGLLDAINTVRKVK
ncbi:MAG: chitinase [Flavisolibacter sp.]|nr:chitinase [Flavisolibacter sp.]